MNKNITITKTKEGSILRVNAKDLFVFNESETERLSALLASTAQEEPDEWYGSSCMMTYPDNSIACVVSTNYVGQDTYAIVVSGRPSKDALFPVFGVGYYTLRDILSCVDTLNDDDEL